MRLFDEYEPVDNCHAPSNPLFCSTVFVGTVKVARVRLNVVGQDGVGKTCLVRLLLGQAFEEHASTCGIDLSKASVTLMKSHCSTIEGDPTMWQLLSWKEHKEKLNQAFESADRSSSAICLKLINCTIYVYRSKAGQKQAEKEVRHHSVRQTEGLETWRMRAYWTLLCTMYFVDASQHKRLQSPASHRPLTKEQRDKIEALLNDSTRFGSQTDVILMTICDFGGQEPFLTAHAALMPSSPLSMYMLVFNGAQLLTDKATSSFRTKGIDGRIVHEPQKLCRMQTNDDFLKHWSSSVLIAHPPQQAGSFFGEEVERLPAIFPIATHRKLAEEAKLNKDHSSFDFIKANDDHLKKLFWKNKCQHHFVPPSSSNVDVCFPVENKTSGTDDPIAREIRNKANKIAKSYWQKQAEQPARWLKFEDAIGELKTITGRHTAELDEVKEVARLCQISDEGELGEALIHLMNVGAVYHFPEIPGLRNIVFHDFNWLFNLLASFVGSVHSKPKGLRPHWQEAVESGFLSLQLVDYLLKNVAEVEERDYDAAKGILCHFDVLIERKGSGDKGYYSACFIQDDFRRETKFSQAFKCSQKSSLPLPLLIFAKDVLFFPEPLYFRLATRIIGKHSMASADSVPLKRNRLIFFFSPGVNAEFLYQGARNCVSVTLFPNNERKPLTEEQNSKLAKACHEFREWLIKSVDEAKQRGMAGLQTELHCQVEETKPNGQFSETLAKLEGFSADTDMWSVAKGTRQLDDEELDGMKLWFDKTK